MKRDDRSRKTFPMKDRMTLLAAMRHLKSCSQASHHDIARWLDMPESTASLWLRTYKVDWRFVDKTKLDRLTQRARQRRDAESKDDPDVWILKNAADVRDAVRSECQWLLRRMGRPEGCGAVVDYVHEMGSNSASWWFRHREKSLSWWLEQIADHAEGSKAA